MTTWPYVGIDESNSGKSPEFFVAVFSDKQEDTEIKTGRMPKPRAKHNTIRDRLRGRDYAFVLVTKEGRRTAEERDKLFGLVVGSLLLGEKLSSPLELYIDGTMPSRRKDYVKEATAQVTGRDCSDVHITCGREYDRKVNVINIADEVAHWLFTQRVEEISQYDEFKPLRTDLLS